MTINCGTKLFDEIDQTQLAAGELAFWWLGQHSFVVKIGERVLYFDPFLTEMPERRVKSLLAPSEITNADVVFGSHDHADHIDRPVWPAIAAASPQAVFILPELVREQVAAETGIEGSRILGLDDEQSLDHRGIFVTAIASAHEFFDRDPATGLHPYLGFIVEVDGLRIYHSGDTCRYEGLVGKLLRQPIDVAFLPINGRDASRYRANIIGNMTFQEAADLAGEFGPRLVVPTHYDMFDGNLADPEEFRAYIEVKYPCLRAMVCQPGERVVLRRDEH